MGISSTLLKAAVSVAEKLSSEKAMLVIAGKSPEKLPVQFNPSEYKITERSSYTEKSRREKDEPVVNFSGRPMATMNVKLYFDCDDLTSLAGLASGAVAAITGGGEDKDITKTINKAKKAVTIAGYSGVLTEQKSPRMSPDRTKARTMTEDNNIWNMAQNEYGDVREWRRIADANGIMNPLDIPVGKVLRVPSINNS